MSATEKPCARKAADRGYALRPNCYGRGWCRWCQGTGWQLADPSKRCTSCAGRADCPLCEGDGQLQADHPAITDWKDAPEPPTVSSKKPSALSVDTMRADATLVATHLRRLASSDANERVSALRELAESPRASDDLLVACEALLEDRALALIYAPDSYGEIRWLAADAVAALRSALGRNESVVVDDVFAPTSVVRIEALARDARVPMQGSEPIQTLERLAALGSFRDGASRVSRSRSACVLAVSAVAGASAQTIACMIAPISRLVERRDRAAALTSLRSLGCGE